MVFSPALLENPAEINRRIQALESERLALQKHTEANNDNKVQEKANELSNSLQLAIRNNDLDTLDALTISYGEIPSLVKARSLILLKIELEQQRFNQLEFDDIKRQLKTITSIDFHQLKEIKESISHLKAPEHKTELQFEFESLVSSFIPESSQLFKDSIASSKWLRTGVIDEKAQTYFINLVNLQSLIRTDDDVLIAFELIASNFRVSFDYHFNSTNETNRIDKPELFYTYHLNYLDQHLVNINKLWNLNSTDLSQLSAHSEFIRASLVPLIEKVQSYLEIIRKNKDDSTSTEILIHLISETLQYDEVLINGFYYDPANDGKWAGIFQYFRYDDLEAWMTREIQTSSTNFESIVNSINCFQIDYTSVGADELKPTISAVKLKILFENITKNFSKVFKLQYESLPQLNKFKLKFFSKIYLHLLTSYLNRLNDGFDAFNELFKSNKSLNTGIDISGTNGIERILRIYSSIKFISNSLNFWNQEFIFIELNTLFNRLTSSSQTISLFTSILKDYRTLELKTWELLERFIDSSIKSLSKRYLSLNTWNSHKADLDLKISVELVPLIETLSEYIGFIGRIITARQLQLLRNHISYVLSEFFFNSIIKTNHFNSSTVNQLSLDIQTVWSRLSLPVEFPLYFKLIEALKLLSLSEVQTKQFTNLTLSQYAKASEYSDIREFLLLEYLRDTDILDVLLRIH